MATDEARLLDAVRGYREELIAFTEALVAIPTQNPPGEAYPACAELLAERLRELGLPPEVIAVPGPDDDQYPRTCLQSYLGAGERTLYFHGHYDVVPADAGQFVPRRVGDRLYGRGASDMKGGLAAMIYAARALADCGLPATGRIGLTIVPDEETGGQRGSRYLAEQGLLGRGAIGMILPEPTNGTMIWNANRGAITLRVTARGRHAHVGQHYRGINAFEGMLAAANALLALKAEVEQRETRYRLDSEADPAAASRSILMLGGRTEGGTSFNAVPATCSFTVERRINPEEDLATERARLFAVLDEVRGRGIALDVEVLQEGDAAGSAEGTPVARALLGAIGAVKGIAPSFELCPGLLENRWYARLGIPAYAYGPGILDVSHGPEEYAELAGIPEAAAIYALTAARLFGGG
jgi:acetylornithine deacetylase/succinyl-diaminopimelate desuccinylase family protein